MIVEQTLFNYYSINMILDDKKRVMHDWVHVDLFDDFISKHNLLQINNIKYSSNMVRDMIENGLVDDLGVMSYILKRYMVNCIYGDEFEYLYDRLALDTEIIEHSIMYACIDLSLGKLTNYDNRIDQLLDRKYYLEVSSSEDHYIDGIIENMQEEIKHAAKELLYYIDVFVDRYSKFTNFKRIVELVLEDLSLDTAQECGTLNGVLGEIVYLLENVKKFDCSGFYDL